jgi:hypothetical protein
VWDDECEGAFLRGVGEKRGGERKNGWVGWTEWKNILERESTYWKGEMGKIYQKGSPFTLHEKW